VVDMYIVISDYTFSYVVLYSILSGINYILFCMRFYSTLCGIIFCYIVLYFISEIIFYFKWYSMVS